MKTRLPADRIDEEAARWSLRLETGALGDAARAELDAWLRAAPAHRAAFEGYRKLSADLDVHIEARLGAAAESAVRANRSRRRWTFGLAAATALAFLGVAGLRLARHAPEVATGSAERRQITLADGSTVELNARSAVEPAFGRAERRIRLTRGEAMFAVTRDPLRPFIVETPVGAVRAVGTEFDVRSSGAERVEVTVLEGTVRIEARGDAAQARPVTAGEQAVVSATGVAVRRLPEGSAQDAVAWRQGQVVFDETPLRDVIERFAAYHTRAIVVDPAAADLRLGGRYSLADLDGLLESIGQVLPVRVTTESGAVRITAAPVRQL